jgi:hypothetical protein
MNTIRTTKRTTNAPASTTSTARRRVFPPTLSAPTSAMASSFDARDAGSIGVNPTVANIDITTATTDWLWAVFAIMLVSDLVFIFLSFRVSSRAGMYASVLTPRLWSSSSSAPSARGCSTSSRFSSSPPPPLPTSPWPPTSARPRSVPSSLVARPTARPVPSGYILHFHRVSLC